MVNTTACFEALNNGVVAIGDADISGPGVIFAFILSACLTILAVLAAYIFGLVDDGLLGAVDVLIFRVPSRASKWPRTHVALRKAILACSDQQIVTGIAILGAGFQGLRTGKISVYHFHTVIYLAWMSSSVHLSALTLLRPFMQHHRGVLVWRCAGMLVLMVMLVIALVPTVSNDWNVITLDPNYNYTNNTAYGVPAICFWGESYGDGTNPDAAISYLVLIVSYLWKLGGLFQPVVSSWEKLVMNPLQGVMEWPLHLLARRYQAKRRLMTLWLFRLWLVVFIPTMAIIEVANSFSAALWLSVLGLIYGTMQILIPREYIQIVTPSLEAQESEFGFGQLVPLILLVQPLASVTEHIWLVGGEDEAVYRGDEVERNRDSVLSYFERSSSIPAPHGVSLCEYAAAYEVPQWSKTSPSRAQLKAILYFSWTFRLMIILVQLAIAGTSVFIFYWDYQTIGLDVNSSWTWIGFACAIFVVISVLFVLVMAPWSKLGRVPRREAVNRGSIDAAKVVRAPGDSSFSEKLQMSSSNAVKQTAWSHSTPD